MFFVQRSLHKSSLAKLWDDRVTKEAEFHSRNQEKKNKTKNTITTHDACGGSFEDFRCFASLSGEANKTKLTADVNLEFLMRNSSVCGLSKTAMNSRMQMMSFGSYLCELILYIRGGLSLPRDGNAILPG